MKIGFNTPLTYTDGTAIPATELSAAKYTLFIDTVNPPVKSYAVPAANVTAATANADGSQHVTVDAVKDLGITVTPNETYYIAAQDSVSGATSVETTLVTYKYSPTPNPPTAVSAA